ncbi:MAG: ATP synthase F1 subunit delta [Bacteroidia bacterium]|nr:ATP synthase F1 subunit delta [Bacteroidia bacterium]
MVETKVARRYAKSLLGLAQERDLTEKVYADMELINATCQASRDFVTLLRNPIVQGDKKEAVLKALFGPKFNDLSNEFINIIIRKGRENHLDAIAAEFISLYKESKGIVIAYVTTATPMDAALRETIMGMVRKSKGDKVELVEKVDPSLIGGFILRVGDEQHNTSVSRKLKQLKNEFGVNLYVKEY